MRNCQAPLYVWKEMLVGVMNELWRDFFKMSSSDSYTESKRDADEGTESKRDAGTYAIVVHSNERPNEREIHITSLSEKDIRRLKWNWAFVSLLCSMISIGYISPLSTIHQFIINPTSEELNKTGHHEVIKAS